MDGDIHYPFVHVYISDGLAVLLIALCGQRVVNFTNANFYIYKPKSHFTAHVRL